MPILFSAAEANTGIIYWAIIESIDVNQNETTCHYCNLIPITPERKRSELQRRAENRPLSDDLIRPYAICWTPRFLM